MGRILLGGTVKPAGEVIVYDGTGRHAALTAAEKLRLSGCDVDFFGLDGRLAMEMSYAEQVIWRRRTYEFGIEPKLDRRLQRVERHGNRLRVSFRNELMTVSWRDRRGQVAESKTRLDHLVRGGGVLILARGPALTAGRCSGLDA